MTRDAVRDPPADAAAAGRHADSEHLLREAYTMALYIAIVLLAALTASGDHGEEVEIPVLPLLWGTTVGLALAHWYAFSLGARLAAGGSKLRENFELALAQLGGAVAIALVATVPILVLPESSERDVARFEIAAVIGVAAYLAARSDGAGRLRRVVYAAAALVGAGVVAALKNALGGH